MVISVLCTTELLGEADVRIWEGILEWMIPPLRTLGLDIRSALKKISIGGEGWSSVAECVLHARGPRCDLQYLHQKNR